MWVCGWMKEWERVWVWFTITPLLRLIEWGWRDRSADRRRLKGALLKKSQHRPAIKAWPYGAITLKTQSCILFNDSCEVAIQRRWYVVSLLRTNWWKAYCMSISCSGRRIMFFFLLPISWKAGWPIADIILRNYKSFKNGLKYKCVK